jgi:hypothetical protein
VRKKSKLGRKGVFRDQQGVFNNFTVNFPVMRTVQLIFFLAISLLFAACGADTTSSESANEETSTSSTASTSPTQESAPANPTAIANLDELRTKLGDQADVLLQVAEEICECTKKLSELNDRYAHFYNVEKDREKAEALRPEIDKVWAEQYRCQQAAEQKFESPSEEELPKNDCIQAGLEVACPELAFFIKSLRDERTSTEY